MLRAPIRRVPNLVLEVAFGRLVGHVNAPPGPVELPAVIHAAKSRLLVATVEEGRSTVRTIVAEQPYLTVSVPKRDQILAEQSHPQWRTIHFELSWVEKRQPVPSHELAHRGAWPDPTECLV